MKFSGVWPGVAVLARCGSAGRRIDRCWKAFLLLLTIGLFPLAYAESKTSLQIPALRSSIASKTLLTDSVRLSDRVVAVGSNGVILYSKDGVEWIQAEVPTQVLLTTLFFIDDREGWAAGHDTLILHTTDGGETWAIQYEDPITGGDLPKPILDIYFKDKRHGWAIGAFSLMLATRDGGVTWETVDTSELYDLLEKLGAEPEANFNAFYPFDDGFFIVGELGTLLYYRTAAEEDTDGESAAIDGNLESAADTGAAAAPATGDERAEGSVAGPWRVFESPYAGSFFGVKRLRNGEILIYGLRGHLFRATRLGDPWVQIDTGDRTANINDVIELSSGEVIAVGAGGTLFRIDLQANKAVLIPYGGFDGFVSVQEAGPHQLLLFGEAGVKPFTLPQP